MAPIEIKIDVPAPLCETEQRIELLAYTGRTDAFWMA
jgi:hypothetical protein